MNIPKSVHIAIDALIDIALNSRAGIPVAIREVAKRQQVSLSYLEELIAALKSANLVQSIRGRNGGYLLAALPEQISVGDIILAINPIRKRKIELTNLAKDLLQSLEDYLKECVANVAQAQATEYCLNSLQNLKLGSLYECYSESVNKLTVKPKLDVQQVYLIKHEPQKHELPTGPNSVFSFGQYLLKN